jgi:MFS transporter, DHA2 family, methylenomycin A resistance protein
LSRSEASQVVSSFLLTSAILIVPFGILSRYICVETIFIAGLVIFGVGSLEFVLSSSKAWLLTSRCVQGFGAAMFAPMIPVMLVSIDRTHSGFVLAVWASYSGVVSATAPIVAGIILVYGNWRAAQVLIFGAALIAALAYSTFWKTASAERATEKMMSVSLLLSRKNVLVLIYVLITYAMTIFLIVYGSLELGEDDWLPT